MLAKLLVLFIITPIIELALLIQLGGVVGFWPTMGLIVFTAVMGSYLLKREGFSVWRRLNERLSTGDLPGNEIVDGFIIAFSGALLLTPGVITDMFGIVGLIPFTRALIRKEIMRRIQRSMKKGAFGMTFAAFDDEKETYHNSTLSSDFQWEGTPESTPKYNQRNLDSREGPSQ